MTEDQEPKPDESPRRAVPKKREDSERALGLEVARLFGISPRLMMPPQATPKAPSEDDEPDSDPDAETPDA
jgi:hypothetical protein